MVTSFLLPPTGFGPGAQPGEGEDAPSYLPMPSGMRVFEPRIPDITDADAAAPAREVLARIARACAHSAETGAGASIVLSGMAPAARKLIAETLGQGEVSMKIRGIPSVAVQESVFAGVWQVLGAGVDRVEIGAVPARALAAFDPVRPGLGLDAPRGPDVFNAPALLAELLDKSAAFRPGTDPHVLNLTLLPHTQGDLDWLDDGLGQGAVTILSRGYGNCRIEATATPFVWRVRFYNSMDTLILDTFEVTDMPLVALAAPEDLADSAERLDEVLEAIG
ncbi:hydrogenase expression/formation protein [Rhodovulum strictum]|uniref:Hydrogenase expression/formation protein n=1 Tax=Rhodovulum strictum TaxID=58314 RepID=A0A844BI52_9RHOB|nr:hydrogenase expression/formation protein [Rhodovulum strictum]MRH20643.1 hydrogenase expression/formation protein [Rhodovulum strictum]